MSKPRIVHVINGLYPGGAEVMLLELLSLSERSGYEPHVVSLISGGTLESRVRQMGIPLHSLYPKGRVPDPRAVPWLTSYLRSVRPAVVQGWMYHSNLIAGLAARAARSVPVAWGVHHTNLSPAYIKRSTSVVVHASARLSARLPAAIVCCAEASRSVHAGIGYDASRMLVIPNGFDLDRFKPNPAARAAIRAELGVSDSAPLIGMLARFNPQKDHRNLIAAMELVFERIPDAHVVLSGWGVTWESDELRGLIEATGRRDRFHLLGVRSDTPALHAALDAACLSSESGEAFPLVIGEAMASGVPCAVTDVGDSAIIVGDLGRVAPPKDPAALAGGLVSLLELPQAARAQLGARCRESIAVRFSLPEIGRRYEGLWDVISVDRGLARAA